MARSPEPPLSTRETLYTVSMELFRSHGFDEVSVSRITREAGVAKGTFFNHFPTKDHVLAEALHRMVSEAMVVVRNRRVPGSDAIPALFSALTDALEKDRKVARAIVPVVAALPPAGGDLPHEEERIRAWIQDRLGEALPMRVPLRETDHQTLAALLTGALRGALEEWARSGCGPTRTVRSSIIERVAFLLESAGFPTSL
jgi:AcrR family transcriptional regulator